MSLIFNSDAIVPNLEVIPPSPPKKKPRERRIASQDYQSIEEEARVELDELINQHGRLFNEDQSTAMRAASLCGDLAEALMYQGRIEESVATAKKGMEHLSPYTFDGSLEIAVIRSKLLIFSVMCDDVREEIPAFQVGISHLSSLEDESGQVQACVADLYLEIAKKIMVYGLWERVSTLLAHSMAAMRKIDDPPPDLLGELYYYIFESYMKKRARSLDERRLLNQKARKAIKNAKLTLITKDLELRVLTPSSRKTAGKLMKVFCKTLKKEQFSDCDDIKLTEKLARKGIYYLRGYDHCLQNLDSEAQFLCGELYLELFLALSKQLGREEEAMSTAGEGLSILEEMDGERSLLLQSQLRSLLVDIHIQNTEFFEAEHLAVSGIGKIDDIGNWNGLSGELQQVCLDLTTKLVKLYISLERFEEAADVANGGLVRASNVVGGEEVADDYKEIRDICLSRLEEPPQAHIGDKRSTTYLDPDQTVPKRSPKKQKLS